MKGPAKEMHRLKSLQNKGTNAAKTTYGRVAAFFASKKFGDLVNALTVAAFVTGLLALFMLIWLYVRPIQTASIKVPVATDKASYYPGQQISGIFFGEIFYKGEVRVLREVFCKNYKNIIEPPASARNGDFYDTQSTPRKLEGLLVTIGNLPENVPIGTNCVLQFTNIYNVQTPFGIRHLEYQYYTQNFAIVTKERRLQLECEATGRKDCDFLGTEAPEQPEAEQLPQSSPETPSASPNEPETIINDNRTTNNTTNNTESTTAEPAPRFVERCRVDFIIKIGCRDVEAN